MYNIKEILDNRVLLKVVAKQVFDAVDTDGSGRVSEDELHTILCSLAEDFGFERPSLTETGKILEFVDIDRSGLIDLKEFTRLLKKVLKAVRQDDENILRTKRKESHEEEEEVEDI